MMQGDPVNNCRPRMKHVFLLIAAVLVGIQLNPVSIGLARSPGESRHVILDAGRIGDFHWSATSWRDQGAGGDRRPCLGVALGPLPHAPSDPLEIPVGSENCGSVQPVPNLLSVVDELVKPKVTVLAMAFPPQTASVTLFLAGRKARNISMKTLPAHRLRKAHLAPFRYAALALIGNTCVVRFVAHSKNGKILDDGGRMHCRGHS